MQRKGKFNGCDIQRSFSCLTLFKNKLISTLELSSYKQISIILLVTERNIVSRHFLSCQ